MGKGKGRGSRKVGVGKEGGRDGLRQCNWNSAPQKWKGEEREEGGWDGKEKRGRDSSSSLPFSFSWAHVKEGRRVKPSLLFPPFPSPAAEMTREVLRREEEERKEEEQSLKGERGVPRASH